MIAKLYKQDGTIYDITGACESITWSGSWSQAGRTAEFNYLNAPYDPALRIPAVAVGDCLGLEDDREGEVFFGQIFGVVRSSAIGTITYTATDMMRHLLESQGQYKFTNVTPEAIAAQVCADVEVPVRTLTPTGVNIESLIFDKVSLYDIIMTAYTKAHRITGDKYFPMIYKRGFSVYKAEWIVSGFTLSDASNITSSSIEETYDSMVNRVKIYDANGAQIGQVDDADSAARYGVFQEIYTQEDGVDPQTAAKTMLKVLPAQKINITAIGDINCLSCYFVQVTDGATGLSGRYWISSDKHTWSHGVHTMELELTYDSMMDEKESNSEEEKEATA